MPAARLDATLRAPVDGGVVLVLIGGLAGIAHGATRATTTSTRGARRNPPAP